MMESQRYFHQICQQVLEFTFVKVYYGVIIGKDISGFLSDWILREREHDQ